MEGSVVVVFGNSGRGGLSNWRKKLKLSNSKGLCSYGMGVANHALVLTLRGFRCFRMFLMAKASPNAVCSTWCGCQCEF